MILSTSLTLSLLLTFAITKISSNTISNCTPGESPDGKELWCPTLNDTDIYISIKNTIILLDCRKPYDWVWASFPKLKSTATTLHIKQCPLTEHGYQQVLEKFGLQNITYLRVSYSQTRTNITLTKNHIAGLPNLDILSIGESNIIALEHDVFENNPNVRRINLEQNYLTEIPDVFTKTQNIRELALHRNQIRTIKNNSLKNLPQLEKLTLYQNQIENIEENSFQQTPHIYTLELSSNLLQKLPDNVFQSLENLQEINLSINKIESLPLGLFSNNKHLTTFKIAGNKGIIIPDKFFANLTELNFTMISSCGLETLEENLFEGCTKLSMLRLDTNRLKNIPEKFFKDTKNLKFLYFQYNFLEVINEMTFAHLENLEFLTLEHNKIHTIHPDAFKNNKELKYISFKNNQIRFPQFTSENLNPFRFALKLEDLILTYNKIDFFSNLWFMPNLKQLELNFNYITELKFNSGINHSSFNLDINLQYNDITNIDVSELEEFVKTLGHNLDANTSTKKNIRVALLHNRLKCDCTNYGFLRYLHGNIDSNVEALVDFRRDVLECDSPKHFKQFVFNGIDPRLLVCPVNDSRICPSLCKCVSRPWDTSLIINCSARNLTEAPRLQGNKDFKFYNQTIVDLTDNRLKALPDETMGYDNVTTLYAIGNWIRNVSWLPKRIEVVQLEDNNLTYISPEIINQLNNSASLKYISLHNNPWECDCSIMPLVNFFLHHSIAHKSEISCYNSSRLIINIKPEDVCKDDITLLLVLALIIVILLVVVVILSAIYYKNQEEIKVWLFAHRLFLWWIKEEDLDKDKPYDAFISYSHFDEEFVSKLKLQLESGPNPYKLLVHYRDWTPGEGIAQQIAKSVKDSKRTLVVLSSNFLKSVWGKMEFRTAHETAMKENRPRLIVVVYGDIDNNKEQFEDVKTYLKTKAFIKWSDARFWDALKFYLPHKEEVKVNNRSNKLNNIMLNIDKFDLLATPTTPNNTSTPPAFQEDPLVVKQNPLKYIVDGSVQNTPPAEGGQRMIEVIC